MKGVAEPQIQQGILKTFVGGLPYHCHEEELQQFMEQFGIVEQIYISKDGQGQHKGFAFVNFSHIHQTQQLFGEHSFKSKIIEVKINLLNHLFFQSVPQFVSGGEIRKAIESLGFPVVNVALGTGHNGIPTGTCSVKLLDDYQLSNASLIGKIVVKGVSIYMEAKTNKFIAAKPFKDTAVPARRKNSKKALHQFSSEKKSKNQYPDFSPTVSNIPLHETGLFDSGLMMTATRPSDSEFSNGEFKEAQDFLFSTPDNKRKHSASLLEFSNEFPSFRNKFASIELSPAEIGRFANSRLFEDPDIMPATMTRHNSESVTGTSIDSSGLPRRLSSFSTSFYSGNVHRDHIFNALMPEVKIAFYTFPGRD